MWKSLEQQGWSTLPWENWTRFSDLCLSCSFDMFGIKLHSPALLVNMCGVCNVPRISGYFCVFFCHNEALIEHVECWTVRVYCLFLLVHTVGLCFKWTRSWHAVRPRLKANEFISILNWPLWKAEWNAWYHNLLLAASHSHPDITHTTLCLLIVFVIINCTEGDNGAH